MKPGLTYDDVILVPKFNNISSRRDPTIRLNTKLTRNMEMDIPILAANMSSVIGEDLAKILTKYISIPIFHRFADEETKKRWIEEFPDAFLSCGVKEEELKQIVEIYNTTLAHEDNELRGVCIDIAHGHSDKMLEAVKYLKSMTDLEVIAGNVCTARAVHDLHLAGADAVKVGVGPGSACTTRAVTGFGVPQFTAIKECADEASLYDLPVIADGGIRDSRDIVLALAAGASSVMIGKLFALTNESAAEKKWFDLKVIDGSFIRGTTYKAKYRGQASEDFQMDYFSEVKNVPEGEAFWGEVSGSATEVLDNLLGGIRSGFTYGGARNIKELQKKAEFMEVRPSYIREMSVRS